MCSICVKESERVHVSNVMHIVSVRESVCVCVFTVYAFVFVFVCVFVCVCVCVCE